MGKNNTLYSILFALLAGTLFFLILWYLPGVNVFVFYAVLVGLLLITLSQKQGRDSMNKLLFAGISVLLLSLIPLYRTNLVYVSLTFLALPLIFYTFFVIPREDLKKLGLVHLILLPFTFVISWLYDLVVAIKSFTLKGARQRLKDSSAKQYILGLLASIPFLIIFLILFLSADAVFNNYFQQVVDLSFIADFLEGLFDDEEMLDLLGRLFFSAVFTIYFFAVYHAIFLGKSGWNVVNEKLDGIIDKVKPTWSPKSLGTLLLPLNLLFGLFVIVQMKYLFGGEESISGLGDTLGYTFSEYARRGFIELIIVSFIVFLLVGVLQSKAKLKKDQRPNWYKGNVIALLTLTFVVGLSALSRLQLLASVYGLTNLRLFGFFVIVAILVLIPATVYSVVKEKRVFWFNKIFAWAILITILLLTVIPTDLLVARYNISRYEQTGEIDVSYLLLLSAEAQVYTADFLMSDQVPKSTQLIASYYYSEAYDLMIERDYPWSSFNISRWRFSNLLEKRFENGKDPLDAVESHIEDITEQYSEKLTEGEFNQAYEKFWSLNTSKSELKEFEDLKITNIMYKPNFVDENWLFNMIGFSLFEGGVSMMAVPVDLQVTYDGTEYFCPDLMLVYGIQNGEIVIQESESFPLGMPFYQDSHYYEPDLIQLPPDIGPSDEPIPGQMWSYGCL